MKLVWHAEGLLETEWLREMLGDLVEEEQTDLDLACYDDDTIHVVSSNWKPLPSYESYFEECRRRCRRLHLIHLSDEWFSGGYRLYRHFDSVVRNFFTYLAHGPGIVTIPEGYSNGTPSGHRKPADQRRFAWSFIGELKASRIDMVAQFRQLQPHCLISTSSISDSGGHKVSKADYIDCLADTAFSPCPMGNVILETWRLYECLELGCIPLVESRLSLDYFKTLLGRNPIPAFRRWPDAHRYAAALYDDKSALLAGQAEIQRWWSDHKAATRRVVHELLLGPSKSSALAQFARLPRNRFPVVHEPLRLAELARHQSPASLKRRLSRPMAPLRRITRDSLRSGA